MKYIFSILLILSLSTNSLADVKYLPKGTLAPYTGYLFTPEGAEKVRLTVLQLEYQESLTASLQKTIDLKDESIAIADKRVVLYQEQTSKLAQDLQDQKSKDFWNNFIYFGLGAVTAGALAIGLDKALNNGR